MSERHYIEVVPPAAPGAGRLGRHREWDVRNEAHKVTALHDAGALPPKIWSRRLPPLDQGDLGACTAYGFCGVARTKPVTGTLTSAMRRMVGDPVALYEATTVADEFEGAYPPDDTGSSVLAVMKQAKAWGIISGYQWATTIGEAVNAIALVGSAEVGFNWYEGMDRPDDQGMVEPTGQVRGGHAFQAIGRIWDVDRWVWLFVNSWGLSWPQKPALGRPGWFAMSELWVQKLLEEHGDFAVPLPQPHSTNR